MSAFVETMAKFRAFHEATNDLLEDTPGDDGGFLVHPDFAHQVFFFSYIAGGLLRRLRRAHTRSERKRIRRKIANLRARTERKRRF